jgi:hypothetical protein
MDIVISGLNGERQKNSVESIKNAGLKVSLFKCVRNSKSVFGMDRSLPFLRDMIESKKRFPYIVSNDDLIWNENFEVDDEYDLILYCPQKNGIDAFCINTSKAKKYLLKTLPDVLYGAGWWDNILKILVERSDLKIKYDYYESCGHTPHKSAWRGGGKRENLYNRYLMELIR